MRFFLLDRIDAITAGRSARGIKNITLADDVFDEHFPEHPLFPGTLIVEALAQLGGFLCECTYHAANADTRRAVLMHIRNAKFARPVRPGDQLELAVELTGELDTAMQIEGTASVRGQAVAEASINFRLIEVHSPALHEARRALYRTWLQDLDPQCPIR